MSSSSSEQVTTLTSLADYLGSLEIDYEDIESATNNFANENLIAENTSFKVYRGQLSHSGELIDIVARKCLQRSVAFNEMTMSKDIKHKNVVSIFRVATSDDDDDELIIFIINKHEANGSLDKHLSGSTLTWIQRLHICVCVADALRYIHNIEDDESVIHGNIKSSHILLDSNWEPKLKGFGFATRGKRHHLHPASKYNNGSSEYMDPEYERTGGLTHKSDVFSFGVILFEVLFGRKASSANPIPDDGDGWYFARVARSHYETGTLDEMIHPDLRKQMNLSSLEIFSETAYCCLKKVRALRPDMDLVFKRLAIALELQEKYQSTVTLSNDLKGTTTADDSRRRPTTADDSRRRQPAYQMADVEASYHGGDGGGEDPSRPRPPSFGCGGCFANRGKGTRKPNLGGKKAGRQTRDKTRNQKLKDAVAVNKHKPVEIEFEEGADNTVVPTGPYAGHWGNLFGELVRSIPMNYPSWQKVDAAHQDALMARLGTFYDLEPHRRSARWTRIHGAIHSQFTKSYNTNKATLKRECFKKNPNTGAPDLEETRAARPDGFSVQQWEDQIKFWLDPKMVHKSTTNSGNRSKQGPPSRHGSRTIPRTRHLMKEASATKELPSEIDTFYRLHADENGVFRDPEALRIYDQMRELERTGEHTTAEINRICRGGKYRGHIPGVGQVLPGYVTGRPSSSAPPDRNDFMWELMRNDDRYADACARWESGGAGPSGAACDDGEDEDDDDGREDDGDDTS